MRFGRSILGYDCFTGEDVPFAAEFSSDAEFWRALTEEPRRYDVWMLSGFVAMVPREPSPALDDLAAQRATAFDSFRAPMSAQDAGH